MRKLLSYAFSIVSGIILLTGCGSQMTDSIPTGTSDNIHRAGAIVPGSWYTLNVLPDTNLVLDVDNTGGVKNGSNVQVWTFTGRNNQKWMFVDHADGYYYIVSKANQSMVLDADNLPGPVGNGTNVHVWEYHGGDNQLWKVEYIQQKQIRIRSKANLSAVIDADVAPGPLHNGSNVHLWENCDNPNQKWVLWL